MPKRIPQPGREIETLPSGLRMRKSQGWGCPGAQSRVGWCGQGRLPEGGRAVSWRGKCTQLPRQATAGWHLALTLFRSEAWGRLLRFLGSVSSSVNWNQ